MPKLVLMCLKSSYPHFSQERRSLITETLPDLGLTLVFTPAIKRQSVGASSSLHQNQLDFEQKAIYLA